MMSDLNIFSKTFRTTFLFLVLAELLSYLAFFYPLLNSIGFVLILFFTILLSLVKLEYGIFILLAELIIGSKGYLFSLEGGGIAVSIRLGLFLAVLGVWLLTGLRRKKPASGKTFRLSKPYFLFFMMVVWGFLLGLVRKNSFGDIFFDMNGYLYFGLLPVFLTALNSSLAIRQSLEVMFAGLAAMITKTIFLLFIFSHQIVSLFPSLYRWVRQSGVGEITEMPNHFWRIFFQSHLYALFFFFVIIILFLLRSNPTLTKKSALFFGILGTLANLVVFTSYSRSFWLGAAAGFLGLFGLTIFVLKLPIKTIAITAILLLVNFGVVYGLVQGILKFPWPRAGILLEGNLLSERTKGIEGEAGASTRLQLLPPLMAKIQEHPIMGSGFGTTVTYRTSDPRALETHPSGLYTTYAFEWGYLDLWIKLGVFGLLAYGWLLVRLLQQGWNLFRRRDNDPIRQILLLSLFLTIGILLVIHVTTPYLNHPLGIGYLLFATAIFHWIETRKTETA